MKTEHKLIAAVALVVVLGVAVWYARKTERQDAASRTVTAASAELPKLSFTKDDLGQITKVEIKNKDKGEVTLERTAPPKADKKDAAKGDAGAEGEDELDLEGKGKDDQPYGTWKVAKPLDAPANQANVKSLIDNLEKLQIQELITKSPDGYAKYELEGDKAIHVVAYKGADKLLDMTFGKSGSRGQMARIAGVDGVYVVKGFSSFVYGRELKNWRNTDLWKLEDKDAVGVEIDNDHGRFVFSKKDDKWSGELTPRKDGTLEPKPVKWDKFDPKKVEDMLRAYKALRATDFAEKDADTGVDEPVKNGGLLVIKMKDEAASKKLEVGKKQKNDDRYARVAGGDGTVVVLSSWTAKWAVAKASDFEKPEDKKKDDKKTDDKSDVPADDDVGDDDVGLE